LSSFAPRGKLLDGVPRDRGVVPFQPSSQAESLLRALHGAKLDRFVSAV